MSEVHTDNVALVDRLRRALYDFDRERSPALVADVFTPEAAIHLCFPFEDLDGPGELLDRALFPLASALPDLERRDTIVMAGNDPDGEAWVGCCGNYVGTFQSAFLGIPATGRPVAMRFHEFFRVVAGRVVEMQALWDLPELMMQAGVWPMGPSLGRDWQVPGPATQDGLRRADRDPSRAAESLDHVLGMLGDMGRHPAEPEEVMRLDHWWHPTFSWYGPAGIGTSRGIDGFRRWHQAPFLSAMPDRHGGYDGVGHFFADGDYVAVTAWPGMGMTYTGPGWLGIAPNGAAITMRSLDFWRVEQTEDGDGSLRPKIRENWVLVDLLHVWDQLGVSVLDRMLELATPRRASSASR